MSAKVIQFPTSMTTRPTTDVTTTPTGEVSTLKEVVRLLLPYRGDAEINFAICGLELRLQQILDEQAVSCE